MSYMLQSTNLASTRNVRIKTSMSKFILVYSMYFGFILNTPITSRLIDITAGTDSWLFVYTAPIILSAAFVIIFSLFAIPYLIKPIFIILALTSATASYATTKYGVIFDYSMIENIFETHTSEAISYVNASSIAYFFFAGVIPALLVALVKFDTSAPLRLRIVKRVGLLLSAVVILGLITGLFYKEYASVGRNNSYLNKLIVPTHVYYSYKYVNKTFFTKPLAYKEQGNDATLAKTANGKPTLMVLVVGETARSMNISYNGYERNTNPYTKDMGIISFKDVSSCGTATAHSLPCMFSNLNRNGYDKARANAQDGALDVLAKANVSLLWKENDGGDKAVAKSIAKITIDPIQYSDVCDGSVCNDMVMLKEFDNEVAELKGDKLIAMHIIGSHGPTYWKRYPPEHALFKPACNQSDIENCTDDSIVNVYDNTIAYTDYVIAETIKKLQGYSDQYNVALMYISDHGESLGERGLYLHGTPYSLAPEEQTKVPLFMWIPEQYANAKGIDKSCLIDKANNGSFSQDNFFHTLISFYGVESSVVNEDLDIMNTCKY